MMIVSPKISTNTMRKIGNNGDRRCTGRTLPRPSTGAAVVLFNHGTHPVEAYAEHNSMSVADYVDQLGAALTPDQVGQAVIDIVLRAEPVAEYLLSGQGLRPLPAT